LNGIPADKSPPVVLVVEDEPLLRMLAVEVVEEAGFIAIEAWDAADRHGSGDVGHT
jgi:hypothetical protein